MQGPIPSSTPPTLPQISIMTTMSDEKNFAKHIDHPEAVDAIAQRQEAMEAETAESDMTVLQAVKAYPMACFWAFVMSFTIVSRSIFNADI